MHSFTGKAIIMMVFSILSIPVLAQYEIDALRFSKLNPSGTARYTATGGAFSAIGDDFSAISNNPAGIGLFRSSQLTISPSLYIATSSSDFQGNNFDDERVNANLGNLGLVFKIRYNKTKTTGLQFLNLALGYNRIQNFNRSLFFQGTDAQHAMNTTFLANAQGKTPDILDPFREQLAFNTYYIDTLGGATNYISPGPNALLNKGQSLQVISKGSGGEFTAAGAINFANRLFFGASFAIVRLSFDESSTYSEADIDNLSANFNSMSYTEKLNVTGTGINLKFGVIGRPLDWLRIGLSVHTPTWYGMDETYSNSMATSMSFGSYTAESPIGIFDYNLTTPWRIQASLGFVIKKLALIGAEYEFVDYRAANLRPTQAVFLGPNAFIDTAYVQAHNFKIGVEVRWDPLRFRAGYNYYMNPFASSAQLDATLQHISGGVGYKSKKWFFMDLTYVAGISKGRQFISRDFPDKEPATVNNFTNNIVFTLGANF